MTPSADLKSQKCRDPWKVDICNYLGWPSKAARQQNAINYENQKRQINRLSVNRTSPKSIKEARKTFGSSFNDHSTTKARMYDRRSMTITD